MSKLHVIISSISDDTWLIDIEWLKLAICVIGWQAQDE